jgi:LacI family transcriptional regulator
VRDDDRVGRPVRAATLHTVAALAGCSTATVSKALNGLPVSPENLRRVRAAAEALGYVPNVAARSVRGGQTMTIGIVMNLDFHPDTGLLAILNSTIVDMEEHGYTVLISTARSGAAEVDTLLRRLIERRVDGLFYWNARPAKSLALYARAQIPVLAVALRDDACADLPLVTQESLPTYRRVMARLGALGHRVVGELGSPNPAQRSHDAAARAEGLTWRRLDAADDAASVHSLLASLLASDDRPTALLAPYPTALLVLDACERLGLSVPGDFSLVALNDSAGAALLRTPLATVRTDFEALGHAAAAAMLRALDGETLTDLIEPTGIDWVERASIGPPVRSRPAR